jgi:predicted flap endonuclease-1-like 5' DNA nuclease
VRGVGEAYAQRLRAAGIGDAAALAKASVAKVVEILAVTPVRARALIEAARSLGNE